ncbi:phosphoribosyl-ATP diphosphatase [Nitrosomonas sp.]|jgi:phosphoribosyl-ATP pyrophosphohydrolase|uniref:phosphoribosyl-ATP diphosphatase n=1 Tax=Nitrosomonas sp. TaxID=42353 RepID=UPI001B45AC37|nr:phosphoribosyl-ATP diphosphatase [Nitrosomonas sp.]MBK9663752.1 phosphoribosyl-ATP diphosphatase [Nitrosomonas sp.]MBP6367284.1 phosphoribosyl-ATP diphosphatase [Nitrosomonas sp.]MBP7111771.1 phosphoribosyl-ATP diphosphatase [Nitrosomonas sp.]MBP9870508.1 phosphoribosyl-ATP diphosphatase [Nitrosomonas sp.]MDO8333720.1 phosphoribosyl-ATP diphosphatase [Nitrosomonas sp.]
MTDLTILRRLAQTIEERKQADANSSYVAKLLHGGQDKILKKIAEESAETLMASKDGNTNQVIYETADLWFHCLILLAYHGLTPDDVLNELERREGVSGIEEKASRTKD